MGAGDKSPLPFYFDNRAQLDFSPPRQSSHFFTKISFALSHIFGYNNIITLINLI